MMTARHQVYFATVLFLLLSGAGLRAQTGGTTPQRMHGRVLFLGDSITYAGGYVAAVECELLRRGVDVECVLNLGLPSETVSGLSEAGHAGGRFPRPDLHERLERVLQATRPDWVLACYGINCGIYQPFDASRFAAYQSGMQQLVGQVRAAGANVIIITPPCYDDGRSKLGFSYNDVLGKYSDWLLAQRRMGWTVLDLHGPMTRELARRRSADPQFTFQPDAVHPNAAGHQFMAATIVAELGVKSIASAGDARPDLNDESRRVVTQRMQLLRDAYLSHAGHQRPGIRAGKALPAALHAARQLSEGVRLSEPGGDTAED